MNKPSPNIKQPAFKSVVREVVEEVTKPQFEEIRADILTAIQSMMQEFKSDLAAMKDEIVAELQTTREESTIHKGQHERFDEIEQRVEKLEHIHLHGHQSIP